MRIDSKAVIGQIDVVLGIVQQASKEAHYSDLSDLGPDRLSELNTLMADAIRRFSPPDSQYRLQSAAILQEYGNAGLFRACLQLTVVLTSLKTVYEHGLLESMDELVHADLFGDFLEMARYLLDSGYKDPAAMLAGAVLEEHLRKLCLKNGIPITTVDARGDAKQKVINSLNTDLYRKPVYPKPEMQQVTAWAGIRNSADHALFHEYTKEQVDGMVQGILGFITRYPA